MRMRQSCDTEKDTLQTEKISLWNPPAQFQEVNCVPTSDGMCAYHSDKQSAKQLSLATKNVVIHFFPN